MNLDNIPVKELLKSSPFYFAHKIFNYRVDGAHSKILQHLIDEKYGLTLVARGHGKSKILQAYLTFLAVNNPDIRIILVSDTDTKAVAFLKVIKQTIESSPILKKYYPNLIGKQWSDHSIEIAGRTHIMTEPTIMAVGSGSGAATGLHCDYLALDDLVSFDSSRSELQRERTKSWFRTTLLPVLMPTGKISIVGCLPTNTKILMANGAWNNIQDIEIGDKIYSFDKIDNKLIIKDVEDVIYQGTDKIYEIKTTYSSIKANNIHPFLVIAPVSHYINKSGKNKGEHYKITNYEYKWKQLQNLNKGDLLLTINKIDEGEDKISSDLAWLFGFMTGDGWITKTSEIRNLKFFADPLPIIEKDRFLFDGAIDRIKTIKKYNIDPINLSKGSHQKVIRICDKCGNQDELKYQSYFRQDHPDLCNSCSRKKENNPTYKGEKLKNYYINMYNLYGNIDNFKYQNKEYNGCKVCVSPGIYDNIINRVLNIFKNEFNINFKFKPNEGYYLATSKLTGEFFINNGLKRGAKNKDIPDWVFKSSLKKRKSFIRGLLDADGSIINRKKDGDKNNTKSTEWRIEVTSKKLIEDLKLLCSTCGYKTGIIRSRKRVAQPPNSPKPVHTETWGIYISFKNKLSDILKDCQEKFPINNFRFEKVKSINYIGKDDIWDLTVNDTHNFIAEGFITHNTRYHPQDFYSMIMDELHYKTLILKAIQPDNTALIPWLVPYDNVFNTNGELIQKGLKTIREELGKLIFDMQYQNSVELANENHIIKYNYINYYDSIQWRDNKLYVNVKGSSIEIKKINLGVDPAIGEKESNDFSGMCVIGKGSDENFYVLEVSNKHLTLNTQIKEIQRLVNTWQVNQTLIEDIAYQKALIQEL
ncbi:MAG: LAGLIDADG family homing endonuclease, partial [Promethearchaeota archaeon]